MNTESVTVWQDFHLFVILRVSGSAIQRRKSMSRMSWFWEIVIPKTDSMLVKAKLIPSRGLT